jgi:riboflavin synthase
MFTGIVQGLCEITGVVDEQNLRRLTVDLGKLADGLELGASIAINGSCLTVTACEATRVSFDVIQETLNLTNLAELTVTELVNVERSLGFGDEIGGHILSGHVSASVQVADIVETTNTRDLSFAVPAPWMKYLYHKGFVALDGASLTIAATNPAANTISISLIPETIKRTTLGLVQCGAKVNLEIDSQTQTVVETVERLLDSATFQEQLVARLQMLQGAAEQ